MKTQFDKKVKYICESAYAKKAEEIIVMDMRGKTAFCDYFVVMSASSSVRVNTIAEAVREDLEKKGFRPAHKEGLHELSWVLLDYGSVIVHIFQEETRRFYKLESLWGDALQKKFIKD